MMQHVCDEIQVTNTLWFLILRFRESARLQDNFEYGTSGALL